MPLRQYSEYRQDGNVFITQRHCCASSMLLNFPDTNQLKALVDIPNEFALREAQWQLMQSHLKMMRRKVGTLEGELDGIQKHFL